MTPIAFGVPFVDRIGQGALIMGQGRRFPHSWWCIVLIATAFRAITPDPKDLASGNLLRMIYPTVWSDLGSQDEDESLGEVCEPLPTDQGSRIRRATSKTQPPERIAIITRPEMFSPNARRIASYRLEALQPPDLIDALESLRC